MFRLILAGVDATPRAPHVVRAAAELGRKFDARVHLFRSVAVDPDSSAHPDAPDPVEALVAERTRAELVVLASGHPELVLEPPLVTRLPPWRVLTERARALRADLLVVGSHGFAGWDHLFGTTAGHLADHAPCSVLVVHAP